MARERLQKLLAQAGIASRRAAEQLILNGKVRLNGRIVTELGTKADARRDKIEVDGKRIVGEHPAYYLLHKPREVVTTLDDPEGRPTVAGLVRNIPERVFPVGRLDYHTSGALLLTNDGDMTQALLHPRKLVPKTYIAKVKGEVPLPVLQQLREGVTLDDGHKTRKSETFVVNAERGNTWLQITITEGKNRQIHRMLEAVGFAVMRLSRPSFAGLDTEGLRPGQWRPLMQSEIAKLKRDYLNPSMKAEADRKKKARWAKADAEAAAADTPDRQPERARTNKPHRSPRRAQSSS